MSSLYNSRIAGRKSIFERIFGVPQPQWMWDMALELRLPALATAFYVYVNTQLYYDALSAGQKKDSKWGVADGKLLSLQKLHYRFIAVPRYAVEYEYTVDGVTYVSTRATSGSPYRNFMRYFYRDTITEAQYLQAMPVLRVGERCAVFYSKSNPGKHSAVAHDPNSWETSLMAFMAFMPLLMGYYMKSHYFTARQSFMPKPKMRVGFPKLDQETSKPPPPPPRQPTQISPIPRN